MTLSTRLAVVMIALVLFTAAAVGVLSYRDLSAAVVPQALQRLEASVSLRATEFENHVAAARSDVFSFRAAAALDGIIRAASAGDDRARDGISLADWKSRMARRFAAELEAKPNYLQFRIIGTDDGGREILRVMHSGGTVRIVPEAELQRRGGQPYVRAALQAPPGEVYASPIAVNDEDKASDAPSVPVQRVAVSLQRPDGRPFGILVIDVDLRPLFDRLRMELKQGRRVYVVDQEGHFLVHPDAGREFTAGGERVVTLEAEFPALAEAFSDSRPRGRLIDSEDGPLAAATAPANLGHDHRAVIMETQPASVILQPAADLARSIALAALAAVLIAITLAILLSRSLSRSLRQITEAVQAFGHGQPLRAPVAAGGEVGVLARAFDGMASEVQEKAAALEREAGRRRRLFDTSLDLILIVDRHGTFDQVSPSSLSTLGYRPDELVGCNASTFVHPDDLDRVRHEMRRARRGREMRDFETRYIHKDGRTVTLAWTGVWSEPEQQHFFIGRDISERKRIERLKDEFVSTVSHELRTPLTSIAGSLGLLTGGAGGALPQPTMRLLTIAHKNSERLVRLINDILDIEKIESGKMVFNMKQVDVLPLIEQAIESGRGFAEGFGVTIALESDAATAPVRADTDRLTQVVTNLISNACKFSPRGGIVTVGTALTETGIRVTVRDQGPGIPEDFRPRIFEKFAQADATDARQKGGTGLGLSIVKQIVAVLGGTVGFDCPDEGGTLFHIELPRWDCRTARLPDLSPVARVLICDDDRDVANLIAEQLDEAGFAADIALTGEGAIDRAAAFAYDAILVDLALPDFDGITLIQELRSRAETASTPIVVISFDVNRGREDMRSSSLNVLDWLDKPIDIGRLLAVLQRPLARDGARPRLLHVDDDPDVLAMVGRSLGVTADVVSVASADEARDAIARQPFDLIVLDIALSTGSGLDLLPELRDSDGNAIPVIVYSAQGANRAFSAQVHAALNKSRASMESLVAMLRKHIADAPARREEDKEVA